MSSPTINSAQSYGDTSLLTIMNYARALVNDSQAGATGTIGEGQILVDDPTIAAFTQPMLMASIRELYRELRNVGDPTLIRDNVIVQNLPIVDSPVNGPGGPDPAVQTFLSFDGYFDGVQMHSQYLLPSDMIYPEKVWERQTGTNDNFGQMTQSRFGLPSRPQYPTLGEWEWRENKIWFVGSTQNRDIRMRYYAQLPQFFSSTLNYETTFVPIIDCTDAVAYKVAVKYARMLGSPGLQDLVSEAKEQMFQLKNAVTRRAQSIEYNRIPYGHSDGDLNNNWFFGGYI
jgi:hypothetical protein